MEENFDKPSKEKKLPDLNDDEFCVSITKAAELSGLSESQIRYLESLQGITLGRRGPKERNRVYTKQDVRLLRWVAQQDGRPSEIAERLKQKQEEILSSLGYVTLENVIQHEEIALGRDVLISRLVALLLSIWQQEAMQNGGSAGNAIILGAVFGPQDEQWKRAFQQAHVDKHSINLAGSLVAWSTVPKEDVLKDPNTIFGNLNIMYARQTWYLSHHSKLIYDTSRFSNTTDPFAVAILWLPLGGRLPPNEKALLIKRLLSITPQLNRSRPKKKLLEILMRSLKHALDRSPQPDGIPISVFSRGLMGRHSVERGLALLLETCIEPYFPDCYAYIAKIGHDDQLEVLGECGDRAVGYLPEVLAAQEVLPWWVNFVREKAGLALAQDSTVSPFHKDERGSAVCFPLLVLDKVVGVLGIEMVNVNRTAHCLTDRHGFTGAELLRYLICVAEVVAEYLNLMESSVQKAERSKLAYTSEETISWWLDIYYHGGADYSKIIEQTCDWIEQEQIAADETVYMILLDIYRENDLAAKYQGFEVVIDIIRKTRDRIHDVIKKDPVVAELVANKHLVFFKEPVGEHLLLVSVKVPWDYLLILLEQIRGFWRNQADKFIWKGNAIDVILQIGVCRLDGLAGYERKMAVHMMNYHLKRMVQQIYDIQGQEGRSLKHVLQYKAMVETEKI